MFRKHRGKPGHGHSAVVAPWVADRSVPVRACCCPARPAVKVVLPPAPGRSAPVDLWLCGHHYRLSRAALAGAGARIDELTVPGAAADRTGACGAAAHESVRPV